jgi:hypothetical protein
LSLFDSVQFERGLFAGRQQMSAHTPRDAPA